jgi:hypothetical protein
MAVTTTRTAGKARLPLEVEPFEPPVVIHLEGRPPWLGADLRSADDDPARAAFFDDPGISYPRSR